MNNAPSATTTADNSSGTDGIVEAIVDAVADAEGTSPLELEPLIRVIDPDALGALVRNPGRTVTVEFTYQRYRVRVSTDERTTVAVYDD